MAYQFPSQWHFYVRQRDRSHEWKCQPEKFLSPDVEIHEIILGTSSMFLVSTLAATLAWYSVNDGHYATIYYDMNAYGWPWFFLQFVVIFIWQDYGTYLTHRFYHLPFFYKHFHKMHHKYKQPTAFSVTAIHPVEIVHMQSVLFSPALIFPVHWCEYEYHFKSTNFSYPLISSILFCADVYILSCNHRSFGHHIQGTLVATMATRCHFSRQSSSIYACQLWIQYHLLGQGEINSTSVHYISD